MCIYAQLWPVRGPRSKDTPVTMSTLNTQILVSKYHCAHKEPMLSCCLLPSLFIRACFWQQQPTSSPTVKEACGVEVSNLLYLYFQGILFQHCVYLKKNFFKFKKDIYSWDIQRKRERHRQREKQAPYGEPDAGLHPRTLGSWPEPKADAVLPSHLDVPFFVLFLKEWGTEGEEERES